MALHINHRKLLILHLRFQGQTLNTWYTLYLFLNPKEKLRKIHILKIYFDLLKKRGRKKIWGTHTTCLAPKKLKRRRLVDFMFIQKHSHHAPSFTCWEQEEDLYRPPDWSRKGSRTISIALSPMILITLITLSSSVV